MWNERDRFILPSVEEGTQVTRHPRLQLRM